MISLRTLRRKVKSVKSIQQITRAMKMVSSIRLKYAREKVASTHPYVQKMQDILGRLNLNLKNDKSYEELMLNPLIGQPKKEGRIILVIVTSDRGLCGGFNSNILRKALEFVETHNDKPIDLFLIGKKAQSPIFKRKTFKPKAIKEYSHIFSKLSYKDAETIGTELINLYSSGNVSEIYVIHSYLKSIIQQPIVAEQLLPLSIDKIPTAAKKIDYLCEPSYKELFEILLPRFVKMQLFRILLESLAAEHAARMTAMDAATNNADDVINIMTLQANKVRQEKITQELSELIASAM